jgi:hypothetical protein
MRVSILLLILFISGSGYSQFLSFVPAGLGIEGGIGYNILKFHVKPVEPLYLSYNHYRDAFKLTPALRISYERNIFWKFSLIPLIGYNTFIGKSQEEDNGYKDDIILKTLDMGFFLLFSYKEFQFGPGIKYNRFLQIRQKSYQPPQNSDQSGYWDESDMNWYFADWSVDMGIRINFSYDHFLFSLEGWYSITSLEDKSTKFVDLLLDDLVDVSSQRYQFLLGYRF